MIIEIQSAGSTPESYKDFLSINEEKLWLLKPTGLFLQRGEQAARRERKKRIGVLHVDPVTVESHCVA